MADGNEFPAAILGTITAVASSACTAIVLLLFVVGSSDDGAWGLLEGADALSAVGLLAAAAGRWPSRSRRALAVALSLPALLVTGVILLVAASLEGGVA